VAEVDRLRRRKKTRQSIQEHIQSLYVRESHYSHERTARQYLSPELNCAKLWRLWKTERAAKNLPTACYATYHNVFTTEFNLSFCNPKVDICSTCVDLENKIAAKVGDVHASKVALKVHKGQARRFYTAMKESRLQCDVLTLVSDIQQNLPLPKINITKQYYSRQLWLYNLTFVVHCGCKQAPKNVFVYTWTESQSGKGSNEVCSALAYVLRRLRGRVLKRQYRELHLFSDSCPGQNTNSSMLAFLLTYVNSPADPFKKIHFFFPVRGHSYMPPDRVFG
jgi:hypothetical protein